MLTKVHIVKTMVYSSSHAQMWELDHKEGSYWCLVTMSCPSLVTSWTIACQDLSFMGFPRQEYQGGFPFPSPEDIPYPGVRSVSCISGRVLPLSHQGSPNKWAPKNWCFQIVMLEKTLETSLDCKEINWSILKEINSEYSLERLLLKLKLQFFVHLMWRTGSLEMTLMLGKIENKRRGW